MDEGVQLDTDSGVGDVDAAARIVAEREEAAVAAAARLMVQVRRRHAGDIVIENIAEVVGVVTRCCPLCDSVFVIW
jgi:hypothetical protein